MAKGSIALCVRNSWRDIIWGLLAGETGEGGLKKLLEESLADFV